MPLNSVCAYDAGQVANTHFLAMEYIDGIDLQHLVGSSGKLPIAEACEYIRQAAQGLRHASERGLVHRDIKPSNLLVTRPPAPGGASLPGGGTTATRAGAHKAVVKILDMGLARLGEVEVDNRLTR